ncbi:hypothetical protein [Neokomagataea anthophila]|uniref:Phage abortive infection protein n=1 Tax=Neokomagataea anthophila TaxID=2826925 RepID=A0ABS5E8A6_9PROT|nr:hypothetical protein [Neokomagataea anthophila]MBR0559733.1 hypothetical protein [Neokomagataea anthophila]
MREMLNRLNILEKIVLVLACLLPLGITIFYLWRRYFLYMPYHGHEWIGDYSNWFQSFISMYTLLAIMYTARKTSKIAKKSNAVVKNSTKISEIEVYSQILHEICLKLNGIFSKMNQFIYFIETNNEKAKHAQYDVLCIIYYFEGISQLAYIIENTNYIENDLYYIFLNLKLNDNVLKHIKEDFLTRNIPLIAQLKKGQGDNPSENVRVLASMEKFKADLEIVRSIFPK